MRAKHTICLQMHLVEPRTKLTQLVAVFSWLTWVKSTGIDSGWHVCGSLRFCADSWLSHNDVVHRSLAEEGRHNNTGDPFIVLVSLYLQRNQTAKSIILDCKPHSERRAMATKRTLVPWLFVSATVNISWSWETNVSSVTSVSGMNFTYLKKSSTAVVNLTPRAAWQAVATASPPKWLLANKIPVFST